MMKPVKVGLLPMYVKLYDDALSWMRPKIDAFYETVFRKLQDEGLEVLGHSLCRLEAEFEEAIRSYEKAGAEVLITLHLAYSPSLQSEKPLKNCRLPIVVLDTTPDFDFGPHGSPEGLDYNHGIHGVQDMCNLLVRNGVPFSICAGHYLYSDVCRRAADCARAHAAANALSHLRVGIIGEPFDGMGDFRVEDQQLKNGFGADVIHYPPAVIAEYSRAVSDEEIALQAREDDRFTNLNVPGETYNAVTRTSLAVKKWYEHERLDAFTINFLAAGKTTGLRHMPFDRACRAMEDGIGYAGEGDVLTACLVGALLRGFENTTFVEMFCPNWKDGYVFFSHMGEYNLRVAGRRPEMRIRPFPFGDSGDPYALMAPMMPGRAVLVNLAPIGQGKFRLILVDGEMLKAPDHSRFDGVVSGWFKPDVDLSAMLEKYSQNGGTHHSALVYGVKAQSLLPLANRFGWEPFIL